MQSPTRQTTIRSARESDAASMVDVHMKSFPGFFLTFLGDAFLRELYAATISDQAGIAFVAEENSRVVGFVTGTDEPAGFYRRLLRQRWWRFGRASVWPFIRRPSIAPRLLRAFKKPQQNDIRDSQVSYRGEKR